MGTVTTSTSATATAFGNQRKIDRCQNGVLVELNESTNSSYRISLSTDATTTWTSASNEGYGGASYVANGSIFVDLDDIIHRAYKDANDGYIKYMRGVPSNASRTAYTWSAAVVVENSSTVYDYPDIVAFRNPANPGAWVAWVVYTFSNNNQNKMFARRININADGTNGVSAVEATSAQLAAANTNPGYPSIDFNHTGDGKTVAGGTPHLYVGWSAGATGSGCGIRFRKATYASGSWTWGTEREIDNTRFVVSSAYWLNCLFDGNRVMLVGEVGNTAGSLYSIVAHERDAADSATLTRVLNEINGAAKAMDYGSATYDWAGNLYLFGMGGDAVSRYRKWTRASAAYDATGVVIDATNQQYPHVSSRRGSQGQAVDYVWTDGTASPYSVMSGRVVLNQNPTAPTPVSPADNATWDSATDQTVTLRPNDPDGDGASKVRIRYRPAGTTVAYSYLESTTAVAAGGTASVTVPANTWDGQIEYASQSFDTSGAEGAWSPTRVVTGVPAALAAATGGQGGTSWEVPDLLELIQSERALRAASLV